MAAVIVLYHYVCCEILDLQAVPEVWEVIALILSLKKSDTTLQEFFSL